MTTRPTTAQSPSPVTPIRRSCDHPGKIDSLPVVSIGNFAFRSCTNLSFLNIPASVTSIGQQVFEYCTNLDGITVDPLNFIYSSMDGVLFNKNQNTLIQCPGGKTGVYIVPNSVTNIGFAAFFHCERLIALLQSQPSPV